MDKSEIKQLESGAAWLGSLPPVEAGNIVMNNWRSTEGQARTIEFFFHMHRPNADAILSQMPVKLMVFGASKEYIKVYAPNHHDADQHDYVLVRIAARK